MNMVRSAALCVLLSAIASGAFAQQSSPGWTYGYVPTPAEWNYWFGKKVDWAGAAYCPVTGCTFTGPILTAASTALGAGINVAPGVAPTTPNNGDIWVTAAGIFVQINGSTVGPLAPATASGFAATSPLTVSFPGGIVTYACATCGVTGSPLSQFASTTSAQLAGVISDETGSGSLVFGTSPSISGLTVTGSFTATGLVTLADLAAGTQDTVVGYFSGTSPSATAVPTCSGALTYVAHAFGCNTSAGTGTVTSLTASGGAVTDTGAAITATGNINVQQINPGGRLTLTSGTPITTTDVTNGTTIWYAPLNSQFVPIYNGTVQKLYQFTASTTDTVGLSVVLGSNWASGSAYDWFVALNAGTPVLCSGPAWTSAAAGSSSRGSGAGTTQLALFDGFWTNAVSITCRTSNTTTITVAANQGTYVGSSLMTAAGAATDSAAQRYLFNLYNQSQRKLANTAETTSIWSYTTTTWRQARASTSNQFSVFIGQPGLLIDARVEGQADSSAGFATVGIGVNSTNTDSSDSRQPSACTNRCPVSASLKSFPALGLNNYVWLEAAGVASGTNNYYGQNTSAGIVYQQAGIFGTMLD